MGTLQPAACTADRDLYVWIYRPRASSAKGECWRCASTLQPNALVVLDGRREVCLVCARLDDLVFLPSGDPALTRRARVLSERWRVVASVNAPRRRVRRHGLLVELAALAAAERACAADAHDRGLLRARRQAREAHADLEHVARFAERVLELFPACPPAEADAIAAFTCERGSGRVGRSWQAKELDTRAITIAVRAHVRHRHTRYDQLLAAGVTRSRARALIAAEQRALLERWSRPRATDGEPCPPP